MIIGFLFCWEGGGGGGDVEKLAPPPLGEKTASPQGKRDLPPQEKAAVFTDIYISIPSFV